MPSTPMQETDDAPPRRRHETDAAGPPVRWPAFASPLHSPAVAARLGRVLGVCFLVCFVTGLLSSYQYGPWGWLPIPGAPAWGYRLTQGVHVSTGIASIPLLLAKLWTVYPKLFVWPPVRSMLHGLERLSVAVLVSSALLEVTTGLLNILGWYPWPWGFVFVHHQLGIVVIGALVLHIAVQLPRIREGLSTPVWHRQPPDASGGDRDRDADPDPDPGADRPDTADTADTAGLSRRGLLVAAATGVGVVALTTVGQSLTPLEPLALLAPRRPSSGPQGVPVNKTARAADVLTSAVSPAWVLAVSGPRPFTIDLATLEAMPRVTRELPVACVEGWSVSARWAGIELSELVDRAGGDQDSRVLLRSLQRGGAFASSEIGGGQLSGALLATHLNGSRLSLDHGFPLRLIAPNRAGVLNTKWLSSIEVR